MVYDSKLEETLHKTILKDWKHHSDLIPYCSWHTYEPDFEKDNYLVEVKGRFRDRKEATKYTWIAASLPSTKELVFIFQDANKPMPGARRRKNGTKQTHGEWAEKNNFKYYCVAKKKHYGTKNIFSNQT